MMPQNNCSHEQVSALFPFCCWHEIQFRCHCAYPSLAYVENIIRHITFSCSLLHRGTNTMHVATYIVGFVIDMAPLCVTVASPFIGYFVSIPR